VEVAKAVQRTFCTTAYAKREPSCQEQRQEYSHKTNKSNTSKLLGRSNRSKNNNDRDDEKDDATSLGARRLEVVLVEVLAGKGKDSSHRKRKKYHHHGDKSDKSVITRRSSITVQEMDRLTRSNNNSINTYSSDASKGRGILVRLHEKECHKPWRIKHWVRSPHQIVSPWRVKDQEIEGSNNILQPENIATKPCSIQQWIDSTGNSIVSRVGYWNQSQYHSTGNSNGSILPSMEAIDETEEATITTTTSTEELKQLIQHLQQELIQKTRDTLIL